MNKDKLNETRMNTFGTPMKIIQYNNSRDVRIKFLDEYGYEKDVKYDAFKNGNIYNPYDKEVLGVGCSGLARCTDYPNIHTIWRGMLNRCYNKKSDNYNYYGMKGVNVCSEWLCFENFVKWYNKNYYKLPNDEKLQIDKDLLFNNKLQNKTYSPQNCVLLPVYINNLITVHAKRKEETKNIPIGVKEKTLKNGDKKYQTGITINKKYIHLGTFETADEAFEVYKTEKEKFIKLVADKYKDFIPNVIYEALYNYKINPFQSGQ